METHKEARTKISKEKDLKCELCSSFDKIHIHHKNKNIYDNDLKNLQVLCAKCHYRTHFPNGRYGSLNPFFNRHHNKEMKEKLRILKLGTKLSEETKEKISMNNHCWNKGRKMSIEQRKKLSDKRKQLFKEGKLKSWNKGKNKFNDERYMKFSSWCKEHNQIKNIMGVKNDKTN
jgi:hypothetical protein